jgi:tetratricopeptide (TPR) repeat protein
MDEPAKGISIYIKKIWPFLVSMGGAMVMLLAFFIPSVQDQFDRWEARTIINRYEELGDDFMKEEQFKMAEEAYGKAFELSDNKRVDMEVKRLSAKINRVNSETEWGQELPEDLKEIDFQFLIHFLKGKELEKQRLAAMDCYGVFLAHSGRVVEAKVLFREILSAHPNEARTLVNLGNLLERESNDKEAETSYRKAIVLEPADGWAHYYLGHLLAKHKRWKEAETELGAVIKIDPADSETTKEYRKVKEASK